MPTQRFVAAAPRRSLRDTRRGPRVSVPIGDPTGDCRDRLRAYPRRLATGLLLESPWILGDCERDDRISTSGGYAPPRGLLVVRLTVSFGSIRGGLASIADGDGRERQPGPLLRRQSPGRRCDRGIAEPGPGGHRGRSGRDQPERQRPETARPAARSCRRRPGIRPRARVDASRTSGPPRDTPRRPQVQTERGSSPPLQVVVCSAPRLVPRDALGFAGQDSAGSAFDSRRPRPRQHRRRPQVRRGWRATPQPRRRVLRAPRSMPPGGVLAP